MGHPQALTGATWPRTGGARTRRPNPLRAAAAGDPEPLPSPLHVTRLCRSVLKLGPAPRAALRPHCLGQKGSRAALGGQSRTSQRVPAHRSSSGGKKRPPSFWTTEQNENTATPGIHGGRWPVSQPVSTHLNFPVRTCRALIPHRWAPPTSPTMSSPIMTACHTGKRTQKSRPQGVGPGPLHPR